MANEQHSPPSTQPVVVALHGGVDGLVVGCHGESVADSAAGLLAFRSNTPTNGPSCPSYRRQASMARVWIGGLPSAALALGGYQRKCFISHNPEAWALADVVLDTAGLRAAG
ncbi:hypothetical protein [Thiorhodovibrio litoralis]|uniref:hypothetical protein n=1 Tax=Thiorhodovibrio litoralis TaxID=2952932 RepID=UPI002B259527|nr:hypothetical protein [Thiorhodovibrio litoralis]